MQIPVNSTNIQYFGFSVSFNIYTRTIFFDTSTLTVYNGSGASNVLGISFGLQDEQGINLTQIDFTNPQIPDPSTTTTWALDLSSSISYNFLFEKYLITGAIKDADGMIYNITFPVKNICQPVGFNESGNVDGIFEVIPDCYNNVLTIKDLTPFVYVNQLPISVTKTGTLYYPTGTINPISFNVTPFSNNIIYTGQYRVVCTSVATYDIKDDVYVLINYYTSQPVDILCTKRLSDLTCCITELENTARINCDNSKGEWAREQLASITVPYLNGLVKEVGGQDASYEYELIKKQLNCSCGDTSIKHNEGTPTNPAIYSIVLTGAGGTTVSAPTIVGNTKTYSIASNVYQVIKANGLDNSFSITTDTSTFRVVKYKIGFDYDILSTTILNSIKVNPTNLALLNSLISSVGNISILGLNGKCVIDLNQIDYLLQKAITTNTTITNIVINGNTYNAPNGLYANNQIGVQNWVNSLSLGSFTVTVSTVDSTTFITISSLQNTNTVSTITVLDNSPVTYQFIATTKTLLQVLQAIIDYLCGMTLAQVKLAAALSLEVIDNQGNNTLTNFPTSTTGQDYLTAFTQSFNNLVLKVKNLTDITCAKVQALFQSYPNVAFGSSDFVLGTKAGNCAQLSAKDIALIAISGINNNTDVKTQFCAIQCGTPVPCPDITSISLAITPDGKVGLYGASFSATPTLTQQTTLRYRLCNTTQWITNTISLVLLPNGNISGSSPFIAIANPAAGGCYEVWLQNNCGGNGFIGQISIPAVIPAVTFINNINTNVPTYCCPAGYTITTDKTSCYQIDQQNATYTGASNPVLAQHFQSTVYGTFGTVIYKLNGFNVDGTWPLGDSSLYPNIYTNRLSSEFPNANTFPDPASNIWRNTTSCSSANGTCGRLNYAGIWKQGAQSFIGTLGFSRQINIPTAGVYYIGIGADDIGKVLLNGTVIIQQNIANMSGASYLNTPSQDCGFKFWNVYPVQLQAGPNLIELDVTNAGSIGVSGFEIYNADEATLIAAPNLTTLNTYIVFTSGTIADGKQFDVGNYNCNAYPGYQLVNDGGTYYCRKVLTTNTVSCS